MANTPNFPFEKPKKLNWFEKLFVGGYSIRIGKKYYSFPKTATLMFPGLALSGLFQEGSLADIPFLFYTGLVILAMGFVSFFYFNIFPKRRPIDAKDAEKFITVINDKKDA
jgi:hypothetical protein